VKKNFYSDNVSGAAPEILRAIVESNADDSVPYGGDQYTQELERRMAELFETEVAVYPVGTGTVANGLCAAIVCAPYGSIYCAEISHLHASECGGTEFWSGGNARSVPLPTVDGRIPVSTLVEAIESGALRTADPPPRAISLTQGTEAGTVYSVREVRELAAAARAKNLLVHMDGARFANAVARLGCTPAELTWKAGVDLLSFGATKNGTLCAEAVVFFNRGLADSMWYRRRRAGHLFSKMRFLSAQMVAFLENDFWLRAGRHANEMASRLRQGLADIPGIRFPHPTEINFVLTALPKPVWDGLVAEGFSFSRRGAPRDGIVRIACSWDTPREAVDALIEAAHRHAGLAPAGVAISRGA
jgi:threonine aldolase